jgi:hypothetical protein
MTAQQIGFCVSGEWGEAGAAGGADSVLVVTSDGVLGLVRSVMSDKSPRHSASKKFGRSIKEKRAIKKAKKAIAETDRMAVFLRGESGPGGPGRI